MPPPRQRTRRIELTESGAGTGVLSEGGHSALILIPCVGESPPREVTVMLDTGRMLVVTDDQEGADFLVASLELDGYDVFVCQGPGATRDCPRLHGIQCSLRERVDIAVVDLDCDDDALVCTKVPDDGGTVYVRAPRASSLGRADVSRAIVDARRHVADLHGDPVQDRSVRALDLD